MQTTLSHICEDKKARVIEIQGGTGVRQRLSQMGIHPGDIVTVVRCGALRGPILIRVHGCQVALGRGVASKIIVEEME